MRGSAGHWDTATAYITVLAVEPSGVFFPGNRNNVLLPFNIQQPHAV